MALASSALTALILLAVLAGAALPHVQAEGAANWLINRYALTTPAASSHVEAEWRVSCKVIGSSFASTQCLRAHAVSPVMFSMLVVAHDVCGGQTSPSSGRPRSM